MNRRTLLASALLLAATTAADAQTWTQLQPASAPAARNRPEMVTLPSGKILLHGGRPTNQASFSDTWEWDGITGSWTQLAPNTIPTPTCGQGMAYDPVRDRVVMHAGWTGGAYVTTTWEWDGADWAQVPTATIPPARDWPSFEYDPNGQAVLMFGGHDWNEIVSGAGPKGDTWSFDGNDWTQLSPTTVPPARQGHRMVHDRNRGTVVMFGGSGGPGVGELGDMWEWDGIDWTQLFPNTMPPARQFYSMFWDDNRKKVVMHGGSVGGVISGDTWEWDGLDWKAGGAGGPARQFGSYAYDGLTGQTVQFGGMTATNPIVDSGETWAYSASPQDWTNLGADLAGAGGSPRLLASGPLSAGATVQILLKDALANSTAQMIIGVANVSLPFFGGTLVPSPNLVIPLPTGPEGEIAIGTTYPAGVVAGVPIYLQCWVIDPSGPLGLTASNAVNAISQ